MYIYHERQLGGLCGVHCLNNLLQGPHFGPGDLAEIGVSLDKEEQRLLSDDERPAYNVDSSADGGNFSIQVLALALARFNLELLPAKHPSASPLMKDPAQAAEAFLCQYRDHWFSVRQLADCWWDLNSTGARPTAVSPFYLAAWLMQLVAEGYSIFLVRGAQLPEPKGPGENFHAVRELLEKRAGGNSQYTHLLDMGFREPQIRAAEALAGRDMTQAAALLVRARNPEPTAAQLSSELEGVVLSLDGAAGEALEDGLLELVGLLSLPQLKSARMDLAVLTEVLLSLLAQRREEWPPEVVRASVVAVELLMPPEALAEAEAEAEAKAEALVEGDRLLPMRAVMRQVRKPGGDAPLEAEEEGLD